MVRIYYYETEDYNGLLAVEGTAAVDLDFSQDGTLEMAKSADLSGITGSDTSKFTIQQWKLPVP